MFVVPKRVALRMGVALLLAGSLVLPRTANAQSVMIEGGHGDDVDVLGLEIGSRSLRSWTIHRHWSLDFRVAGRLAYWHGNEHLDDNDELWDASVTPIFRLHPAATWRYATPYLELGVGVHLLSNTSLSGRQFGTAFQFGELVGVGLRFGSRQQYELGIRAQHISNSRIDEHNGGLTFASVGLAYHFPR